MRELLYKNLISKDRNKRDVFVSETVTKNGISASSQRRCLYFVKEKIEIDKTTDLKKLLKMKKYNQDSSKRFHILKVHDSKAGVDKLICKLMGSFYAIAGKTIYRIVYVHSFKIAFATVASKA